jgi:YVTN family beta-propeller protein
MAKPVGYPRWTTAPTDPPAEEAIIEPSEAKKDQGFEAEKPPFSTFNWILNLIYQWIVYLETEAGKSIGRLNANLKQATEFEMTWVPSRNPSVSIPAGIEYCLYAKGFIFASSTNGSTVYKINPLTNTVVATWTGFTAPHGMAFDGTYLWVCNRTANTVFVVNINTGAVVQTITTFGGEGIAFDGTHMWACGNGTTVKKCNIATYAIDATITPSGTPALHDFTFDGLYIWASDYGGSSGTVLYKFDIATNLEVTTVSVGTGPDRLVFDGTHIWCSNRGTDNIVKVDPVANAVVATVALTGGDNPIYFTFDGRFIWCALEGSHKVVRINPLDNTLLQTLTVPGTPSPRGLCFDGTYIWVANASGASPTMYKIAVI